MKFLNLYKKFKSDNPNLDKNTEEQMYKKISFNDLIKYQSLHVPIEIGNKESDIIIKLVSKKFPMSIKRTKILDGLKFEIYPIIGEIIINIEKYDDEWFFLSINYSGKLSIYLCDQIDGLTKCIKNYKK